ncbi:MAG: serine hydrolase, partial [Myxococcota bacterium]
MSNELETAAAEQVGQVVPGLAVVATDANGTLVESAFGLADRGSGAEMAPVTICNWFSMTKL